MKIIGYIKTDFPTKFGLPRQSGLVEEIKGKIIFEKKYRVPEAFRGLSDFSHIWLLWEFSEAKKENWSPTVRPPLLGGNKRMGVFATRSPFRPNSIGLSCVKLDKVAFEDEGPVLYISGADLMNGTPIYDIKPYLAYADAHPDAIGGFTENLNERKLAVNIPEKLLSEIPDNLKTELIKVLSLDPRPSYIDDKDRIYGFIFSEYEIKFKVENKNLYVISIEKFCF
ncbi:MAG: tRNA (N6-threonylcarbamoyladenosine(37)-N6)-methyltransferase TrmO [Acutalibacteraceae bacterium]|nr:tRNA (N6-threonylcarbamoyladenosine(37)-N6)-methyltransferase TrmO [Acutalibacteraceae bacterium]